MKRLTIPLALSLSLALTSPALAADNLIVNGDLEQAENGPDNCADVSLQATGWTSSCWGSGTYSFTYEEETKADGTLNHYQKLTVTSYGSGDAKWMQVAGVPVEPDQYYVLSHRYKAKGDTQVKIWYQTAEQVGTTAGSWLNVDTGVAPADEWTTFQGGVQMPANASRAWVVHLIARNGELSTDDFSMEKAAAPPSLNRGLVTLTFDDSTANLYNYVIPALKTYNFKSTQYVVTGATGTTDQWSNAEIKDVHLRGHEIGSHTVYHPDLSKPGSTKVCQSLNAYNWNTFTPAGADGACAVGTLLNVKGSWLDPFGRDFQWVQPATLESENQKLAETTLEDEVAGSASRLRGDIGGFGVPTIAYPFGAYDSTVIAAAKAAGYKAGRTVDVGFNGKDLADPFKIKVQNIEQSVCVSQAQDAVTKVSTYTKAVRPADNEDAPSCPDATATMSADTTTAEFKSWLQHAKDNNYWLVLVYHSVDDEGTNPYGTSKKRFAEQMQAIKDAGLPVQTMRDALNEVMPQVPGSNWSALPTYAGNDERPLPSDGEIPGPDPTPVIEQPVSPSPIATPTPTTTPAKDTTKPRVRISAPTAKSYKRGQSVRARFTCSDNVRVVKCTGTVANGAKISTRTRGTKTFKVTATDAAGNKTTVSVKYRVKR